MIIKPKSYLFIELASKLIGTVSLAVIAGVAVHAALTNSHWQRGYNTAVEFNREISLECLDQSKVAGGYIAASMISYLECMEARGD